MSSSATSFVTTHEQCCAKPTAGRGAKLKALKACTGRTMPGTGVPPRGRQANHVTHH